MYRFHRPVAACRSSPVRIAEVDEAGLEPVPATAARGLQPIQQVGESMAGDAVDLVGGCRSSGRCAPTDRS
jgi:hypothetical protein